MSESESTFEADIARLERIIDALERGDGDLGRSLAEYEEGIRLLGRCQGRLEGAERSVALLTGVDAEGQPETRPFDAGSSS